MPLKAFFQARPHAHHLKRLRDMEKFDVTIIGSGPGGYVAAIRCGQLGLKTALIEKYNSLGGTCLNVGCIPSKALLDSSEHFYNAARHFKAHGIKINAPEIDMAQMIARKAEVVKTTVAGVNYLMKKNKVTVFTGTGTFLSKNSIEIAKADGTKEQIESKKVIIATGSKPVSLPGVDIDKKRIITSTEALTLQEVPKHLVIIGGGVIGLELGSVYARLGSKVTVVEFMDHIAGSMDGAITKELQRVLQKDLGFEFLLSHKVLAAKNTGDSVVISAENKAGEAMQIEGDYCLVAVGRRPYTDNLGLEAAGITPDAKGRIETDKMLHTQVDGIYAIGDVTKGAMLAHKAMEEGVFVAEVIAGQKPHLNYNLIPGVIYTWPEVASVGYTEEQLKEKNIKYKAGNFPFKASGRAKASGDTDGFVKVLADQTTDEILGVHIIGARAADLIAEVVVAMEYRASAEDIGRMTHAHPTFSEAVKEACLDAFEKRPIHI